MRRRPIVLCCVLILLQVLAWRSDAQGAGRSPALPPAYRVETAGFDASEADIRAVSIRPAGSCGSFSRITRSSRSS